MSDFVHLHNHTHYSICDALCTPSQLLNYAIENGQEAIAITDHGVMFGVIEFYKKAKEIQSEKNIKIKPIIGIEAYVANGSRFEKIAGKTKTKKRNYFHLVLLAKDYEGYHNLLKLTTFAHIEGHYYKPRIDEELIAQYSKGLIAMTACIAGVINPFLVGGDLETAKTKMAFYKDVFGDDFYYELQYHELPEDDIIMARAPKLAKEFGVKLVATNDIHYLRKEDAVAHNVLLYIRPGSNYNTESLEITDLRYRTPEMYFKSTEQMKRLFKDMPEAILNTKEIAEKCNFELKCESCMPEFPLPKDAGTESLSEYLKKLTYEGLKKRFNDRISYEIKERADYELDIIEKMNFPGYFLIVFDLIKAARELGVRVGPGRGSAVGSLIAYALEITNLNPLDYDLLFERFLNPERISMPDIDIDFSDIGREKVIEYVKQKYGENSVAQIISFGKLTSKAVLKAVGRVMNIHHTEINKITAKIPQQLGKVLPLKEALDMPDLQEIRDSNEESIKKLIEYSLLLENLNVNTSTHAAGVVIAPGDIKEYVPLYQSNKEEKTEILTQYSKYDLEYVGLLKMDLLGIQTLSIIDNIIKMIEENYGIKIEIDKIDFNDRATYDLLSSGNTLSIFQFESSGMQEYLFQLKPHNLEELTAMNALYRPGPMSNIPEFIDRKHGKKRIEYLHPLMERALNKTYGIIVYQEQVMQLARDIAGFSLGQADILRRAMGSKKKETMLKMKPQFIKGAQKNGLSESLADEIFHLIEKFAGYGFNKSHALAYSYLAFQTAWLKAHYPTEFYAANMTAEINKPQNKSKTIVALIEEAKKFGIKVVPPDVNQSMDTFTAKGKTILFGLSAIMNVGTVAAKGIIKARSDKPFTSIFDFCSRCDLRQINKKTLEALVCAGAFDSLKSGNRATLYNTIEIALDYGRAYQERITSNTIDLFGESPTASIKEPNLIVVEDWPEKKRLQLEKQFLKFYISGHPMTEYKAYIDALATIKLGDTESNLIGKVVRACGIITDFTTRIDKNKNTFANITIEDFTGSAECILWHNTYNQFRALIDIDNIIIAIGKSELDNNDNIKIIIDQLLTIDEGLNLFAKGISIIINNENNNNIKALESLAKLCKDEEARTNILFNVFNSEKNSYDKYLAKDVNLMLSISNLEKIASIFGKNNIRILNAL